MNNRFEKIVKVLRIGDHCYDGVQSETAIYAKSDSRPGYRWYVGYGGDRMPAAKADLQNIKRVKTVLDSKHIGETVYKYRSGN